MLKIVVGLVLLMLLIVFLCILLAASFIAYDFAHEWVRLGRENRRQWRARDELEILVEHLKELDRQIIWAPYHGYKVGHPLQFARVMLALRIQKLVRENNFSEPLCLRRTKHP